MTSEPDYLDPTPLELLADTLKDAAIVVAYLAALAGPRHAQAVATLRGIVERG
jgi:hypothetical protein